MPKLTLSQWKLVTASAILLTGVVVIAYDIFIAYTVGGPATISQVFYHFCQAEPITALAFGVLFGHLLWPQNKTSINGTPVSISYYDHSYVVKPLYFSFVGQQWIMTAEVCDTGEQKMFVMAYILHWDAFPTNAAKHSY